MRQPQVAIVTGAGSGVGKAAAELLARAGYAVALVARTRTRLEATAARIAAEDAAPPSLIIAEDVTDPGAPQRIVQTTLDRFGRIDALVNVAGSAPLQPIEKITPDIWRQNVDVNLSAPVLLTAAVWPTFQAQQSGVVVNLSSMSSIDPFPGFSIYGAAKVGLNLFTKCTADEGAAIGVRAVAIAPGAVETPMLRINFDETFIPADKTLSPEAVASLVRDCVTGARDFEPGETIILPSP